MQFAAAKELLDRAHGRPRQEIDVNADKSVTVIVQRGGTPTVVSSELFLVTQEGPTVVVDRAGRGASPAILNADSALLTHEEETDD